MTSHRRSYDDASVVVVDVVSVGGSDVRSEVRT
jgi:hypothetical protein